jgi:hypothetical protein
MVLRKVAGLFQVEVQGENSAYYRAHVVDVFDNEVQLRFEDDWQPPSRYSRSYKRPVFNLAPRGRTLTSRVEVGEV